MVITLTGFMGCGKSSVGRALSTLLCCPFMDLDAVIEERAGRSIPEIFAADGEAVFRRMEVDTLNVILSEAKDLSVLALGGGTVMTPECEEMVHEKTLCVYLRTSADTLAERLAGEADGRPMLAGNLMDRINGLMVLRSDTYERTAHLIVDTDGKSVEEIALEICRNLKKMC